jgi:hypothetical protein
MKWNALFLSLITVSTLVAEPWQVMRWNSNGEQSLRQQQRCLRQQQKSWKQQDQRTIQKRALQEQKKWKKEEKKWNQQNTRAF